MPLPCDPRSAHNALATKPGLPRGPGDNPDLRVRNNGFRGGGPKTGRAQCCGTRLKLPPPPIDEKRRAYQQTDAEGNWNKPETVSPAGSTFWKRNTPAASLTAMYANLWRELCRVTVALFTGALVTELVTAPATDPGFFGVVAGTCAADNEAVSTIVRRQRVMLMLSTEILSWPAPARPSAEHNSSPKSSGAGRWRAAWTGQMALSGAALPKRHRPTTPALAVVRFGPEFRPAWASFA